MKNKINLIAAVLVLVISLTIFGIFSQPSEAQLFLSTLLTFGVATGFVALAIFLE